MKKLLPVIVSGILMICPEIFPAHASGNISFSYRVENDGSAVITGVSGFPDILDIPEKIDSHTVTAIADKAFFGNENITSANIPDTVTNIGGYAFSGCLNMTDIKLPQTLSSIGKGCFMSCVSLEKIQLGKALEAVPENCFTDCSALRYISIPHSVKSVGAEAFLGCTGMSFAYVPHTVTSIGKDSFGMRYDIRSGKTEPVDYFSIKTAPFAPAGEYAIANGITIASVIGDVNDDNEIDAADASAVLTEYSRLTNHIPSEFDRYMNYTADMDNDGAIDSADASQILKIYSDIQNPVHSEW